MSEVILDIETIPDLEFGKKHMNLEGLSDADAVSYTHLTLPTILLV